MKDIKDYFGTKTAIKCENEQQWEKLKELCGDRLEENYDFEEDYWYFMLDEVGNSFTNSFEEKNDYTILPYSDFVSDVPELVGVEMEVSQDEKQWLVRKVLGTIEGKYLTDYLALWKHARPIKYKKVLTATLTELAEMLNVDEIQLK